MSDKEWIGVDLDGTLATWTEWTAWNEFGPPVPAMVERVRQWIREGMEVRVFTARVGPPGEEYHLGINVCRKTRERWSSHDMAEAIGDWTERVIGVRLRATCVKDVHMRELWDDRAVQVITNTGRSLAEEHDAERRARRGAP